MDQRWLEHLKRAAQLQRAGELAEAERVYRQILAVTPEQPLVLHLYGVLLKQRGELVAAEAQLRRASLYDPTSAPIQFALAATQRELGRAADALEHYRSGLSLDPSWHEAWLEQAELLLSLGHLQRADASFERAAQLKQPSPAALSARLRCLSELGQDDKARGLLEPALVQLSSPALQVQLAQLLERAGDRAGSVSWLERALAQDPSQWPALIGLSRAAHDAGDAALAESLVARAQALAPERYEPLEALALICAAEGKAPVLQRAADALLVRAPGHSGATSLALIARAVCGGPELDPSQPGLVQRQHLSPSSASWPVESYNDQLAREVTKHPSLSYAPSSHATVEGYHTGELRVTPSEALAALVAAIEPAIASYGERLSAAAREVVAPRPAQARLNMWAVVLGQHGHQRPHIHPEAWLSGVYYVRVPSDEEPGGQLELGQPPPELAFARTWPTLTLRPETGMLVLFPSWLYHRTLPLLGHSERISIAFDVCDVLAQQR